MRREKEVVVLNPDKESHPMKHRRRFSNPDNLKDVAIDSGMALAAGAAVAAGAGAVMVGVSKIEYAASTPAADQAMYRTALASGILALVGAGMQYGGPKVAGAGKALLVGAVAIPGSVFVANKLSAAMAPALPAPATGTSSGMYAFAPSSVYVPQAQLGPSYATSGFPNVGANVSSYVPQR